MKNTYNFNFVSDGLDNIEIPKDHNDEENYSELNFNLSFDYKTIEQFDGLDVTITSDLDKKPKFGHTIVLAAGVIASSFIAPSIQSLNTENTCYLTLHNTKTNSECLMFDMKEENNMVNDVVTTREYDAYKKHLDDKFEFTNDKIEENKGKIVEAIQNTEDIKKKMITEDNLVSTLIKGIWIKIIAGISVAGLVLNFINQLYKLKQNFS